MGSTARSKNWARSARRSWLVSFISSCRRENAGVSFQYAVNIASSIFLIVAIAVLGSSLLLSSSWHLPQVFSMRDSTVMVLPRPGSSQSRAALLEELTLTQLRAVVAAIFAACSKSKENYESISIEFMHACMPTSRRSYVPRSSRMAPNITIVQYHCNCNCNEDEHYTLRVSMLYVRALQCYRVV